MGRGKDSTDEIVSRVTKSTDLIIGVSEGGHANVAAHLLHFLRWYRPGLSQALRDRLAGIGGPSTQVEQLGWLCVCERDLLFSNSVRLDRGSGLCLSGLEPIFVRCRPEGSIRRLG